MMQPRTLAAAIAASACLTLLACGNETNGVSPAQRAKNQALMDALRPSCEACHGGGRGLPFLDSIEAFEDLLIYNPRLVVPGAANDSELLRLLKGEGKRIYKAMPPSGPSFTELQTQRGGISVADVATFIDSLPPRDSGVAAASPAAPTVRRLSALEIVTALQDQLGLTEADFFAADGRSLDADDLPVRNPDSVFRADSNYIASFAVPRWVALGGANHLGRVRASQEFTLAFAENLTQLSQRWCALALQKSNSPLLVHATLATSADDVAPVRQNLAYLYQRMLGQTPTEHDIDRLFTLFATYQTQPEPVGWVAVCTALIRHPLWIAY